MSRNMTTATLAAFLTPAQLAARYGLAEKTIRNWAADPKGDCPTPVMRGKALLGFTAAAITEFEESHTKTRVDAIYTKREKERLGIR